MKIGFFPMCADLLHTGHVLALEEASRHCDYLIVGLNIKPDGKTPYQTAYERYMQLRAVRWVDEVIPYEGKKDMDNVVTSLKYDVRFLGTDYLGKTWDGKEAERAEVHFIERKNEYSSSNLAERIRERERNENKD